MIGKNWWLTTADDCVWWLVVSSDDWGWPAGVGNSRQHAGVSAVAAATRTGAGRPGIGPGAQPTRDIVDEYIYIMQSAELCPLCLLLRLVYVIEHFLP